MNTETCDHQIAEIVDTEGGTTEGRFVEYYECPCGATGTIRGDAEKPPRTWTRTGRVFNE